MHRTYLIVAAALLALVAGAAVWASGSHAAPAEEQRPAEPQVAPEPGPAPLAEAATTIQRTFVSTAGSDTNPCTPAQPCRSFAAALANTTAGGEIVAVDSGGYGPFTIDKSVTIAGAPGAHVAITAFSGTGIHVNADTGDTIVLRNLYLTGLGATTGIRHQAGGTLHLDGVTVNGFTINGLLADAAGTTLLVRHSAFRRNFDGLRASGTLRVEIADSTADRNSNVGFRLMNGARGSIVRSEATRNQWGFTFESGAVVALADVVSDGNTSHGAAAFHAETSVTVSDSVLSNNTNAGLLASLATLRIGGSTVIGNDIGLHRFSGTLESFGDNLVRGNTTDTSGTITVVGKT